MCDVLVAIHPGLETTIWLYLLCGLGATAAYAAAAKLRSFRREEAVRDAAWLAEQHRPELDSAGGDSDD